MLQAWQKRLPIVSGDRNAADWLPSQEQKQDSLSQHTGFVGTSSRTARQVHGFAS